NGFRVVIAQRAVRGLDELIDLELHGTSRHEPDQEEGERGRDPDGQDRLEDRARDGMSPEPAEVAARIPAHADGLAGDRDRGHAERLPLGRGSAQRRRSLESSRRISMYSQT